MSINIFLDRAKKAIGTEEDKELAKHLGIGKTNISNFRSGYSTTPSYEVIFKIAEILQEEPQAIIAALRLEQEKEPSKIEFWKRQAQRYALTAGIIAITTTPASGAVFSGLTTGQESNNKFSILCIMRINTFTQYKLF